MREVAEEDDEEEDDEDKIYEEEFVDEPIDQQEDIDDFYFWRGEMGVGNYEKRKIANLSTQKQA